MNSKCLNDNIIILLYQFGREGCHPEALPHQPPLISYLKKGFQYSINWRAAETFHVAKCKQILNL